MTSGPIPESSPAPTLRRLMWTVVLLMAVAAGMLWAASAVVWVRQRYLTPLSGEQSVAITGATLRPELGPIALATLAGVAALLATSGLLRRIVGLLVLVAGVALGWRALNFSFGWFAYAPLSVPPGSTPVGSTAVSPAGPLLVAAASVLLIVAGLAVVLRAAQMPAMGSRYSAPGGRKRPKRDPDEQLWSALDEGDDPTDDSRR